MCKRCGRSSAGFSHHLGPEPERTLEEVGEVVERPVLRVSVPLPQRQAVEGLQLEGFPLTVHHDNLTGVPVQARHVLEETDTGQNRPVGTQTALDFTQDQLGCSFPASDSGNE